MADEIVAHWDKGSALVKTIAGFYRVRRGELTDTEYIKQLEDHVISKHNALLIASQQVDSRMRLALPVCANCWDARNPDRLAARKGASQPERCACCDIITHDGVYVRMRVEWI